MGKVKDQLLNKSRLDHEEAALLGHFPDLAIVEPWEGSWIILLNLNGLAFVLAQCDSREKVLERGWEYGKLSLSVENREEKKDETK